MNRVKPYDGIDPVQRLVFPALYFRKDTVRYAPYGLCQYTVTELFLQNVLISLVLLPMAYRPMILSARKYDFLPRLGLRLLLVSPKFSAISRSGSSFCKR